MRILINSFVSYLGSKSNKCVDAKVAWRTRVRSTEEAEPFVFAER